MTARPRSDSPAAPSSPSRRAFLRGRSGQPERPLRPPWSVEEGLAERCTRCGDCLSACPEEVLVLGVGGFPAFDPRSGRGECTFCGACAQACPETLFRPLGEKPWRLRAAIGLESCLAGSGIHCETCRDACPEQAVRFAPRIGGPPLPDVLSEACSGCGACVGACPVKAISLQHSQREESAA